MDVTVVIPLYNKAATIERALLSVLRQTCLPARIIVVDDLSTDHSADIVRDIAAKAVVPIGITTLMANAGPARARNEGALQATTTWLAFLDADDEWEPDFLARVVPFADTSAADFASCARKEFNTRKGRLLRTTIALPDLPEGFAVDLTREFWRVARRFVPINSSSNLIRRSLFQSLGGFEEGTRRMEDFALWMRLWLAGRFVFINEPLTRIHKSDNTLSAGPLRVSDIIRFQHVLMTGILEGMRSGRPVFQLLGFFLRFSALAPLSWLRRSLLRAADLRSRDG